MGRLIDADKLKDELITLPMMSNWGEAFVPSLINKQPTAYDIDRVIEQLEELGKEHPYKVIGQPNTYSQYNEAWQDCIDRAIGIVKRGGTK